MPFSLERTELIKVRIQERLISGRSNDWELSFLKNMEKQFNRCGSKTRLSDAQYSKLRKLLNLSNVDPSPKKAPAIAQNVKERTRTNSSPQPKKQRSKANTWNKPKSPLRSVIYKLNSPKRVIRRLERRLFLPVILVFGFLAIVGYLWESAPFSQPTDNAAYLFVTGANVNQRQGPSASDNVMGQLQKGTQVKRINDQGGWTQIVSSLGTGWMSSKFLTSNAPLAAQRVGNTQIGKGSSQSFGNFRQLKARDIRVIDGDTVAISGQQANVRLVGFNTPETRSPSCSAELKVGRQATARLKELVREAEFIQFRRVACACKPGTEGTKKCNFGRQCGFLAFDGTNVGTILIQERLAVSYRCGLTSCPPRPGNWCK